MVKSPSITKTLEQTYIITNPGLDTSKGHDVYARCAADVLSEAGIDYKTESLKPAPGLRHSLITQAGRTLWQQIENGKSALATAEASVGTSFNSVLVDMSGRILDRVSTRLRENPFANALLTHDYQNRVSGHGDHIRIISSHYLGFQVGNLPGVSGLMIGPDIYTQPALKKASRGIEFRTIASCAQHADDMLALGIPLESIVATGQVLPEQVTQSIPARLEKQERINNGQDTHTAFLSIGGSAPELTEMVEAVMQLLEQGICVNVLCGDGRDRNIYFRQRLKELPSSRNLNLQGGTAGFTRQDELDAYMQGIANPEHTIIATRPNETQLITAALGFRQILLQPYQLHERKAYNWLLANTDVQTLAQFTEAPEKPFAVDTYNSGNTPFRPLSEGEFVELATTLV